MGMFDRLFGTKTQKAAVEQPPAKPPDGFETGVESFCWRVLCHSYLRILARQTGRDWTTIPDREVSLLLEPYHRDLERDARMLAAAIAQARAEGVTTVHRALHRAEGLDHEMVDQALAYAYAQTNTQPKAGKR